MKNCVPQNKLDLTATAQNFDFCRNYICFLQWVLVAEVYYSPVVQKWKKFISTSVAKSCIKYGQFHSFSVKKGEWKASFLQNNEILVPTGYMKHKLQQSEKTRL